MQALRPRVEAADAQLGSLLAQGLTASLHMDVTSARRHCLAAFAAAGNTASAEQVLVHSATCILLKSLRCSCAL